MKKFANWFLGLRRGSCVLLASLPGLTLAVATLVLTGSKVLTGCMLALAIESGVLAGIGSGTYTRLEDWLDGRIDAEIN